jgi:hypothetical protein
MASSEHIDSNDRLLFPRAEIRGEGDSFYYCDLCGERFNSLGAVNLHKRSIHYTNNAKIGDNQQWDLGQNLLRIGLTTLWRDFKKEHNLPSVVFLFEDDWHMLRNTKDKSIFPIYFQRKVKDLTNDQLYDAIAFSNQWKLLDAPAKAVSLAHLAAHIENFQNGSSDIEFNESYAHTSSFKRTAKTYYLNVYKFKDAGWAMTHISPKFRSKYDLALKLLSKYHPMQVMTGVRPIRCNVAPKDAFDVPPVL